MQAIQKLPRQALASGAIIMPVVIEQVVIEQITFINAMTETMHPPFCPICQKYIVKNHCSQFITPEHCPIEKR